MSFKENNCIWHSHVKPRLMMGIFLINRFKKNIYASNTKTIGKGMIQTISPPALGK